MKPRTTIHIITLRTTASESAIAHAMWDLREKTGSENIDVLRLPTTLAKPGDPFREIACHYAEGNSGTKLYPTKKRAAKRTTKK